jgi:CRISPR type IV-associated protein Csf3
MINGSPNLTGGPYKDKNMPFPLLLVSQMIAYGSGDRKGIKKILKKHIRSLGRQRSAGYGRIVSVDCVEIEHDWSLVKDGCAMRCLPDENGIRIQRVVPPYWNNTDRIKCCEIGDEYCL